MGQLTLPQHTVTTVVHTVTRLYDPAADQAKAAWAAVDATRFAAIASTAVAVTAVIVAVVGPWDQRRQRLRAVAYTVAHALMVAASIDERFEGAPAHQMVDVSALLAQVRVALEAIQHLNTTPVEDAQLNSIAVNIKTALSLFEAQLEIWRDEKQGPEGFYIPGTVNINNIITAWNPTHTALHGLDEHLTLIRRRIDNPLVGLWDRLRRRHGPALPILAKG